MLRKHASTIATFPGSLRDMIKRYFNIPLGTALVPGMYQRGLGQADLVLALLRVTHWDARHRICLLIGKQITVATPCLLYYRTNGHPTQVPSTTYDDRKITFVVADNPRQNGTEAALRWPLFQVGRTVGQLRVRGVKKRDLRRAVRMGWIKLEESRA